MILLPFYTCPFKISIVVPTLTHVREVVEYTDSVGVFNDYADMQFSKISNYIFCWFFTYKKFPVRQCSR